MIWPTADAIDRTAKILIDRGMAKDPDEASQYLGSLVLQVAVGPDLGTDPAAQAALATVVNAGHRAFQGGVHVRLDSDSNLSTGWTTGMSAAEVVARFGGTVVEQLDTDRPTLAIANPGAPVGAPLLHLTWRGWSAGVVEMVADVLHGEGNVLAGIASAALGLSEAFQQALGDVAPGRRDVGISLWRPDEDWRSNESVGPKLEYLPAALWLLGLGHLGQAYAWAVGMLSFAAPQDVEIGLVDFDVVVDGNTATQLLVRDFSVGRRKTRIVAAALESVGLRTRIVERGFDEDFHTVVHANPDRNEPIIALSGFHDGPTRRLLGGAGFARIVDGGLGAGPYEYLDLVVHAFPAPEDPATAFAAQDAPATPLPTAYEEEIRRRTDAGADEAVVRCGILDVAGVTVGASFVGAFTSTLVVADIVRELHDGLRYSVVHVDLRNPSGATAVHNAAPGLPIAPAFTRAR